jgi:hypothetical protein
MNKLSVKAAPTLIVGLGGTGALGLQYAKKKIKRYLLQHGGPDARAPFVEYLVLDTTAQEETVERLPGDEYINMGHQNVTRIIREIDRDSSLKTALSWFPRHIRPGQIDSGARGVRHIGRLCFFLSENEITRRIRTKAERITNHSEVDRILKEEFSGVSVEPGSTVDVHLITSMCGGTGSACLLDTAYLIKHNVEDMTKMDANVTAHLVTTEPFDCDGSIGSSSREYIHYNFAITLAEIERFTDFEVALSESDREHGQNSWSVEYLDGETISSIGKPFSLVYLLGNKEGESLSKGHVCEVIGETIAITTVHPKSRRIKGLLDNPKAHELNGRDTTGKIRTYSSYNTSILSGHYSREMKEASIVIACKAAISNICDDRELGDLVFNQLSGQTKLVGTAGNEIVGDFQDEAAVTDLCKQLKDKSGIESAATKLRDYAGGSAQTGRSFFSRSGTDDDAGKAKKNFERVKSEVVSKADPLKKGMQRTFRDVAEKMDQCLVEMVGNGTNLKSLIGALRRFSAKIRDAISHISILSAELGDPQEYSDDKIRFNLARFIEFGRGKLCTDVLAPLYVDLRRELESLRNRSEALQLKCEENIGFLKAIDEGLIEPSFHEQSYTRRSIRTRDKISADIRRSTMPRLVHQFVNRIESMADLRNGHGKEPAAFFSYLRLTNNRLPIEQALREVAAQVLGEDIFKVSEIPLNLNGTGTGYDALAEQRIADLVSSSRPAWQIEMAGQDIADVSLTNCPQNSRVGDVIDRMGVGIGFDENAAIGDETGIEELFVFRSQHGASASRLMNLRECLKAVKKKLSVEGKAHINDLCLDPEWQIKLPIPDEDTRHLYLLFSLGTLFPDTILISAEICHFSNFLGHDVILADNKGDRIGTVWRYEAFERFVRIRYQGNKDADNLISRINREWDRQRRDSSAVFVPKVASHRDKLENLRQSKAEEHRRLDALNPMDDGRLSRAHQFEREDQQFANEINVLSEYLVKAGVGDTSSKSAPAE